MGFKDKTILYSPKEVVEVLISDLFLAGMGIRVYRIYICKEMGKIGIGAN